jgi:solute carrier family 25 carnitine/acylcarnitine transporter 20/29
VVLVGHPFDTTKTRLQTSPRGFYAGTMDCVRQTVKFEGLKGFYAGMMSPLAGQMFFRAVSFSTFYRALDYLSTDVDQPTIPQFFLAGAVTGCAISVIESPIDLVKIKLQTQIFAASRGLAGSAMQGLRDPGCEKPAFTTVKGCVSHIAKTDGAFALWQGWRATIIRNVPANALFFPVNEVTKRALAARRNVPVSELNMGERLSAGATAGLGYWVCTFPLDVIKARMQANTYLMSTSLGWAGTAKLIYAERGWRGFARGLAPCALRSVPACATMFTTVDCVREHLTKHLD